MIQISRLTQTVRQAGVLKLNSTAILDGRMEPTEPESTTNPENTERVPHRSWYVFDRKVSFGGHTYNPSNPDEIVQFLVTCFDSLLDAPPFNFDLLQDVQVLSPMRRGLIGTENLNRVIQRVIQKKLYKKILEEPPEGKMTTGVLPGDKVIYTRNNKELEVFNGTLGIVQSVSEQHEKKSFLILFEDGVTREIKGKDIRDVQLAYALTVHKSQGSEFPCVITICHHSHYMGGKMLYRNLIYTAVTRAKNVSIVVGDRKGIQWAMGKTGEAAGMERRTWWK